MFSLRPISILLFVFLACILLLNACAKENKESETVSESYSSPVLPEIPFDYELSGGLPAHFTADDIIGGFQTLAETYNAPAHNPVTNEGATLGRVIFYDKNLSADRSISCASCHQQEFGFSDPAVFSEGFDGGLTGRHSMGLANAAYYSRGRFFWDERAATLEEQVLMPIQDPVEMGMSLDELVARLSALDYYPELFEDAFGSPELDSERIALALAQFVRSMVSYESAYDLGRAQVASPYDDFPNFSASENLGKRLFITPVVLGGLGCTDCHSTEGFVNIISGPTANGIDSLQDATDPGYFSVSQNPQDRNTFKVPSLKNVAIRPPYMHDGRFSTLEEVIAHYDHGVNYHPAIPFTLIDADNQPVTLDLRDDEKQGLIDFLHTLTDEPMLTDEKFSDPFED